MKAKRIIVVAFAAAAVLVAIAFIPLNELSNRSAASVLVSSIEARHYPRKVPVVVPQGIRELIDLLKSPKYDGVESEPPTDWKDFPFEEMEKPPPEDLQDKARGYLKDDTIQLEARLYLLFWLSIRGGVDDDMLAPWLEPEVCDELGDAPHGPYP